MAKMWYGSTPKECNLCKEPIDRFFVDGVIKGAGWAILCQPCHKNVGNGLGVGRGQLYRKDEKTGQFTKIEG